MPDTPGSGSDSDDPDYETIEQRMESLKQDLLGDPDLTDAMREELYVMLSAIEGVVVDEVTQIAAEYGESNGGGEVIARSLKVDCLLGLKPSCWVDAFVKYAISTVAHATAAVLTGGASLAPSLGSAAFGAVTGAADALKDGAKKGLSSFLTGVLSGYATSGSGQKCSCDAAIEKDPCERVQPSFVVDPLSVDCGNAGEVRLSVFGANDVRNRTVIWDFVNAHEENDPITQRTHRTTRDFITIRQIDPDKPIYIGAEIHYTADGAFTNDNCRVVATTPNPDDPSVRNWAWNLYSLTSDVGMPVITDGATNLPRRDYSTYRVGGLFRQIPGVNLTSFGPNFAGQITRTFPDDPYAIQITWNVATSQAAVYATTTNNCGDAQPTSLSVNVY